ncbi:MAG: cytochrome b/b6 domain-containing protein [Mariprofundaceae bacterium]|nr:cytochrome b/b6 domain-containing protein [Mariprofundaceae bacterium]
MDTKNEKEVWSLSLRLFHWLLATSFFISWWAIGQHIRVHILAGTVIAGLLLYRLIWGFLGEKHAKFSSFTPSFATIKEHLLGLIKLKARYDIGHTPIGSLMIYALLASLFILVISGLSLIALQMNVGPFYGLQTSYNTEVFIQSTHHRCFEVLQILVFIHLLGIAVESILQRSNLIKSMFTGKKTIKENINT